MKPQHLSPDQKEEFTELFYKKVALDDRASNLPWGCPWYWAFSLYLVGDTIEEYVKYFIDMYKNEMHEPIEE